MLEVPKSLKAKVKEAVAVLHEHFDDYHTNRSKPVPPPPGKGTSHTIDSGARIILSRLLDLYVEYILVYNVIIGLTT